MSFGWTAARDGNQVRFLLAVQLALPARPWLVIDGGLKSFLDEPLPHSGNGTLATVAALIKSTPAISPSRSPSSALSNASARLTVRTDGLPRWETSLRRERSDSASLTLYLMAAMSGSSPHRKIIPKYGSLLILLQIYPEMILARRWGDCGSMADLRQAQDERGFVAWAIALVGQQGDGGAADELAGGGDDTRSGFAGVGYSTR